MFPPVAYQAVYESVNWFISREHVTWPGFRISGAIDYPGIQRMVKEGNETLNSNVRKLLV
jgi:hypothetical protein